MPFAPNMTTPMPEKTNIEEMECVIIGRVQMVMFRDFARRCARRLAIYGWVRNDSDGSVRIVAQGARETLEQFAALLGRGPMFARVDDVRVSWRAPAKHYNDFKIVF